jgi:hypothetical protein
VSPATVQPFKTICEVHHLTLGKGILQFCMNQTDIINPPSHKCHLKLWKKKEVTWH